MDTRNAQVEAWYKANATKIKKWANKRSKQDAEDILQDTAIKLLKSPAKWEAITQRKVTRWAMSEYYSGHVDMLQYEELKHEVPETITHELFVKKSVELVGELIDSLENTKKEIFKLHFFNDMRYDEISKKLNISYRVITRYGEEARQEVKMKFNELIDGKSEINKDIPLDLPIVPGYDPELTLEKLEKQYILKALEYHKNNVAITADALGVSYKTMYNKMNKWK